MLRYYQNDVHLVCKPCEISYHIMSMIFKKTNKFMNIQEDESGANKM